MKELELVPIREFEQFDDEMLALIMGGENSGFEQPCTTKVCTTNLCITNSGTCDTNDCGSNDANCGVNTCKINKAVKPNG